MLFAWIFFFYRINWHIIYECGFGNNKLSSGFWHCPSTKYKWMEKHGTIRIYCMIVRDIWKFIPHGKSYFQKTTPDENMIFWGELIFIFPVHAINYLLYRTTGEYLEYLNLIHVLNVYRFLSMSVLWYKKDLKLLSKNRINHLITSNVHH